MKAKYLLFIFYFIVQQHLVVGQEYEKSFKIASRGQDGSTYLEEAQSVAEKNPTKSIELIQKALQFSIPAKNYKVEGESYQLLGQLNANNNQNDLAIVYYNKALQALEKGNYKVQRLIVLKELTKALLEVNKLDRALEVVNGIGEIVVNGSDVADKIWVNENRASIYRQQGKFDAALLELEKAEKLATANPQLKNKSAALKLEKGGVYEEQLNNSAAFREYNYSEEIAKSSKDKQGVLNSNARQSSLLEKEGRKKEAVEKKIESLNYLDDENEEIQELSIESFESEISSSNASEKVKLAETDVIPELQEPVNIAKEKSKLNMEIGKSYLDLDQNDEAINYLKNAVTNSSKSGEIQTEKDAYGLLSEAYSRTGKFNEALETYKSYVNLVDSIYNLKETQILASLDLNKELSERLQRIASLEKDRTIQEQTIEILENQRLAEEESNKSLITLIYSLIFGLLLLLLLIYFMYRSVKQKRITNQLLALKNLRTQMNPHFIFNALNSVNNFISVSDERSANRYLSEFSRLMRLVLENSEHDFIPLSKELEILNLYVGLEHSRFSEKFEFELKIDPELNIEKYEIPPMIVQPYIENAVWHGLRYLDEKGKLFISIKEESGALMILIEDDGVGRAKSRALKTKNQQQTKSTAMKNIEERLEIINGLHQWQVKILVSDLKVDGTGTKVEIVVKES